MAGPEAEAPRASARRLRANRANSRLSTGPRSEDGKARAARNALRHGLSLGSGSLVGLAPDIAGLAARLAGEGADEARRELAGLAAEAQVDLLRIRHMRRALLASVVAALEQDERARLDADPQDAAENPIGSPGGSGRPSFRTMLQRIADEQRALRDRDQSAGRQAGETAQPAAHRWDLDRLLREMTRLERYERRAFSRRKRALRLLSESKPVAAG